MSVSDDEKVDNVNKIEPKFKVGDFIVSDYCMGKVIALTDDAYLLDTEQGIPFSCEHNAHLWTIQDAKEGDVISNGKIIVIFKKFEDPSYRQHIIAYIGLDTSGDIQITEGTWNLGIDKSKPATKEQRDLLFQKMKEAGYEWDSEKKELKKIVAPKFKVGDTMRTLQEASSGITSGLPVVVSIDNEYYHCNNELIAIKDQNNYEYPPMNKKHNAWSEEDEGILDEIIDFLENGTVKLQHDLSLYASWLKSLKGRVGCEANCTTTKKWKPSDEQMKALDSVIDEYDGYPEFDSLVSLKNDLSKL